MAKAKKTKQEVALEVVKETPFKEFKEKYKQEFFVIKDIDLANIILENIEDINMRGLCLLLGWERGARVEICFNCTKTTKQSLKLGTEKDFICHLIKNDLLPEGNYMVLVTQND